jgi:hypothetical protein
MTIKSRLVRLTTFAIFGVMLATIVEGMVAVRRVLVLVMVMGSISVSGFNGFAWGQPPETPPTASTQSAPTAASAPAETKADDLERPLPDIPTLMQEVLKNQRKEEAVRKDYLYHALQTSRDMDGHGAVKKTETKEYDIFWVGGVPVQRLVKKDGKELSADEQKKENERIDKEVAKAKEKRQKADSQGKETDARGNEEITPSRFLELGSFTNPRRVKLDGRDTIAVDYIGDPKAKTRNRAEDVVRDLLGTVWVDEEDKMIVKLEGHFVNSFKIGGGLVVNIQKGTNFAMQMKKVNGEVWLPVEISGHGAVRYLLVMNFRGDEQAVFSDYRKFKATSTILPGVSTVEPEPDPK